MREVPRWHACWPLKNAVINTAAVQIKTLTVAGKQVTLAVFRQLIEEQSRLAIRRSATPHC